MPGIAPRLATIPRAPLEGIAPRVGMTPRAPLTPTGAPRARGATTPLPTGVPPRVTGAPRAVGMPRARPIAEAAMRPREAGATPLTGEPRVFTGEGFGTILVGVLIGERLATGVILS